MESQREASPQLLAFEAKQNEVVQELHAAIARGREELKVTLEEVEGNNSDGTSNTTTPSPLLALYKQQSTMLDQWETMFDSSWQGLERGNAVQKTEFLCSRTEGLKNLVKNFKAKKEKIEKEAEAAAEREADAGMMGG